MYNNDELNQIGDEPWQMVVPKLFSTQQPSAQTVKLWALVLDSRSIPCCIETRENKLCLTVPPDYYFLAQNELEQFQQENLDWPPVFSVQENVKASLLVTLSMLLLLAIFHNVIHLENAFTGIADISGWPELGRAKASLIRDGQWWRNVTALTLHADWTHLSGNLVIGGIFIFFLCREVGTGLAWFGVLVAGTVGNEANAWLQNPSHSSVGGSTAVFGAVGILASIGMLHYRKNRRKRWQLPVAGGLALLTVLGTEGKNTDLGAHLFGFLAGIMFGLIIAFVTIRKGLPGKWLNALFAFAGMLSVAAAWWFAINSGD